jgi:hypothetical protein
MATMHAIMLLVLILVLLCKVLRFSFTYTICAPKGCRLRHYDIIVQTDRVLKPHDPKAPKLHRGLPKAESSALVQL